MNTVHDVAYLYGFTEKAFNFQEHNFGKTGGEGENDRVWMTIQNPDVGFSNTAFFLTPPE